MWEAFWPLKGMTMQPTKKRALARVVLTALTIAIPTTASHAADYELSPRTLGSALVEKELPFDVRSTLTTPVVEWTAVDPVTTVNAVRVGLLRITAEGTGVAPAAYLIDTCDDAPGLTAHLAIEPRVTMRLTIMNGAAEVRPHTMVNAEASMKRTANLSVNAESIPAPGHYTTCVRVTGLADEPAPE